MAFSSSSTSWSSYNPPSNPTHECREFNAPEGIYQLAHQAFFRSLTPHFGIGSTATLVSIKYKETTPNYLQRYEPQPGARSFRRIFASSSSSGSHVHNHTHSDEGGGAGSSSRTPSLSSSSSSYNRNINNNSKHHHNSNSNTPTMNIFTGLSTPVSPSSVPEGHAVSNNSNSIPRLGSSLEGPSFLSTSPPHILSPSPSTSTTYSTSNYTHHTITTTATTSNNNNNNNSSSSSSSNSTSNNNNGGGFSFLSRNTSVNTRRNKSWTTNITKTTSSFVSRIITNGQLAKILVARTSEDTNLFYNCGNSFVWVDAFGHPKVELLIMMELLFFFSRKTMITQLISIM
ncbi:hypothetical protein BDB00DRAFT_133878 [Zychaea mexicana]|uniref:uncharacterized protein n=1 Tax=Zychaea mexicana TaxID=64656 RepID=UPI0022FF0B6C|nr:uncharacterized protein BDB00DRAFT_133878 [Zychaea mexicana]KAI9484492.1 hypothetical protein BDB00DRAFT_133878 [Zychaea mexicana]